LGVIEANCKLEFITTFDIYKLKKFNTS